MAYDFSNFDQMGASAQMRDYLTKIYPYLLTGGYSDYEYTYTEVESLRIDTQYYFTINKFSNYPDFPTTAGVFAEASAQSTRLGISLNDDEMRPFLLINNVSTSGDFEISSMRLYINKLHSKEINTTNSYNFMLEAINKGDTSWYCRTMTIYQRYDNNHKVNGAPIVYNSGSRKDDDVHGASYWVQNNWSRYGGKYSDYDYFDYSPVIPEYPFLFDAVINSPSYGWKFDTNIPIFDNLDSAMKWVISGDRSEEVIIDKGFSQEYKLYIDGENRPNYKLTWNSELDVDIAEKSKVELLVYNEIGYLDFKTFDYLDGSASFIWNDIDSVLPSKLIDRSEIKFAVRFLYENYEGTICGVTLRRKKTLLNPDLYEDIYYENVVDNSSLEVLIGTGEDDDGYVPPDNTDDGNDEAGDGSYSTSGALTKTYSMTLSRLRSLGSFLWSSSFVDNIHLVNNSPIENIVSVKAFPFNIDGADEIIELGNVDTGVNGELLSSNVFTISKGSVLIDEKYGSFLDYAPYTKVALHLPYIGFVELDTNLIMGKTISVRYVVDLVEGGCLAQVLLGSRVINEYKGDMGIDVPITSSNRAQVQASHVAGAIGIATGIARAGIGGAAHNPMAVTYGISDAASSLLDSAMSPYHYSTQGGGSPAVSSGTGANRNVYVIIDRPMYQDLNAFNHTRGRICNLSKRLGSLKGFTSTSPMIDLNGIPCTGGEKEEIRRILSQGFFA